MAERKVINKYYPPNFDPEKVGRAKGSGGMKPVNIMAPYSMRCNTCLEYIYKGKKFNARKEKAYGENYLGIQIFRFYIRCPQCASEITYKTDPKNHYYEPEQGATRNFEPWREQQANDERKRRLREEEEIYNPMKALENRTSDSKREIDILDALDEIRSINARYQKVDHDKLLEDFTSEKLGEQAKHREEEDRLIDEAFKKKKTSNSTVHITQLPSQKQAKKASDFGIVLKK